MRVMAGHPAHTPGAQPSRPGADQPLGETVLEITRVRFGAWHCRRGLQFGWEPQQDDESVAAIHRALELVVHCTTPPPPTDSGPSSSRRRALRASARSSGPSSISRKNSLLTTATVTRHSPSALAPAEA